MKTDATAFLIVLLVLMSLLLPAPFLAFSARQIRVDGPSEAKEFETFLDALFADEIKKQHIPGAAIVFVKDGKILLSKGYGFANLDREQRIVPERTIFRIGSISKVFTATAVVQLADRRRIDLHKDLNRYLKRLKVPTTFPEPVTSEHLLTHTADFDEIRPGTQASSAQHVLPLADFLRTRLVRTETPGTTIAYSTYGITLAGLLIEEVTGMSFEAYLKQNIWKPLGMNRTSITVPAAFKDDLALGYEYIDGRNQSQAYEWYHTTPASSINSTLVDMAHFMIAHLQNGRLERARIMSERAMLDMHQQHSTGHPKVPGVAYGLFEDSYGDLRILEHGGNMAGFSSQMVLLPERNAGFFIVNHHENSNLRDTIKWSILEHYYPPRQAPHVPKPSPDFNQRAALFVGTYRWNCYCRTCGPRSVPAGHSLRVTSNSDGTLSLSSNPKRWVEVEPLLFIREDGGGKIAFRPDKNGVMTHLFAGGFWVFEKIP
jgi:CubicO group peptidase (beta-lactamase class C family)